MQGTSSWRLCFLLGGLASTGATFKALRLLAARVAKQRRAMVSLRHLKVFEGRLPEDSRRSSRAVGDWQASGGEGLGVAGGLYAPQEHVWEGREEREGREVREERREGRKRRQGREGHRSVMPFLGGNSSLRYFLSGVIWQQRLNNKPLASGIPCHTLCFLCFPECCLLIRFFLSPILHLLSLLLFLFFFFSFFFILLSLFYFFLFPIFFFFPFLSWR